MAEVPAPARLLRRVGGLGEDVGNAEPRGDRRAEPVRRLVIEVVGEPEVGPRRRARRRAESRSASLPPSVAQPLLPRRIAVVSCETRGDRPRGRRSAPRSAPRHGAVARGDGMVRRLQRRVEGDRIVCREAALSAAAGVAGLGQPGGRGSSRKPSSGRSAGRSCRRDHSATSGDSQERVIRSCVGSPEPRSTWMKAGLPECAAAELQRLADLAEDQWSPSGCISDAPRSPGRRRRSRGREELAQMVEGRPLPRPSSKTDQAVGDQPRRLSSSAAAPSAADHEVEPAHAGLAERYSARARRAAAAGSGAEILVDQAVDDRKPVEQAGMCTFDGRRRSAARAAPHHLADR